MWKSVLGALVAGGLFLFSGGRVAHADSAFKRLDSGTLSLFASRPCASLVSLADPRLIPLKFLLKPEYRPKTLCLESESLSVYQRQWRGRFFLYNQPVLFETTEAPQGGNARGHSWKLTLPLALKNRLNLELYPFLGCQQWQSHRYCAWHFSTAETQTHFVISGSNQAQPCQEYFSWAEILRALNQEFRACPATLPEQQSPTQDR